MSPPPWVNKHGQPRPTRACPRCRREVPVNRWPVSTLRTQGWQPYGLATWVEWCGHQQEVVLVPEGDGWYSEIPVLGEAR